MFCYENLVRTQCVLQQVWKYTIVSIYKIKELSDFLNLSNFLTPRVRINSSQFRIWKSTYKLQVYNSIIQSRFQLFRGSHNNRENESAPI